MDVYLNNGWRNVGRCLGLHDGGWLRMVYVRPGRFYMEARDGLNNVPFSTAPPRIVRLNAEPRLANASDAVGAAGDPSVYVGRRPINVIEFYGSLTEMDITTPYLHIPMSFCTTVFPLQNYDVTLVDEEGKAWPCGLMFPTADSQNDALLRGWIHVVEALGLTEGFAYKLEVPVDTTNLIFFGSH